MNLKGKKAMVIGASGGIGKVLCQKLTEEGAELIPVTRAEVDVTKPEQITAFIQKTATKYESLDMLIHVTGIGIYKPIEDLTLEDWEQSFQVNTRSAFLLIQGLLPLLKKAPGSRVMVIGSGAGVIPMRGRSVYCATKFALRGFILSLAEEFAGVDPQFTILTLGSTLTEFGPLTLSQKTEESLQGKAYFTPEWVASKMVETLKLEQIESEYTWYPGDYEFGEWKKP